MADPFDSLRQPAAPLAPRTAFAAELRRRLATELGLDRTVPRTDRPTDDPEEAPVPEIREYTPARLHSVTPYLSCVPAMEAIGWYQDVFGARLLGEPIIMPDGDVGHSELAVGDSVFFVAGEYEPEGVRSPAAAGGTNSVSLMLYVPDADAVIRRALDAGATEVRPASEAHGDRVGIVRDPYGHRWFLSTHLQPDDAPVEDIPGRRYGDIGYVTLRVPDGDRARAFFGALFGWDAGSFQRGQEPGSFHIESVTPPAGIHQQSGEPGPHVYFRVDDIEAAVARVRELGGQVLAVRDYDSGGNAECVDDQGLRFDLFRPRPGY